jgi:hypothetical protein
MYGLLNRSFSSRSIASSRPAIRAGINLSLPDPQVRVCFFLLSRPSSTCSHYEKSRSLEMLSSTACKSSSLILPSSEGMSVRASSAVSQQSVPVHSYSQHDYVLTLSITAHLASNSLSCSIHSPSCALSNSASCVKVSASLVTCCTVSLPLKRAKVAR